MTTSQPTPPPTNATSASAERPQPRFAPGPLGRGVFLSDLVRWLMKKHEATRVQVVKDYLCPVLLEKCPQLGFVQASGDTTSVLEREWYLSGSGNREAFTRMRSRGYEYIDGNLTHIPGDPIKSTKSMGKGTEGAVKWLQAYWGDARNLDAVMDHQGTLAAYLAVTEADARRCWRWRSADEAASVVDAVAKPAEAQPAVDKAGNPSDASDGSPAWLTGCGYNVAWLQGERDKFRLQGGHYMAKLIAHLETKGVQVPGKDKKKEIDRYTDGKPRGKKATPWEGLGASKKVGAR